MTRNPIPTETDMRKIIGRALKVSKTTDDTGIIEVVVGQSKWPCPIGDLVVNEDYNPVAVDVNKVFGDKYPMSSLQIPIELTHTNLAGVQ